MKLRDIESFYSNNSKVYDNRWIKKGGQRTYIKQNEIFHKLNKDINFKSGLEIGCGTGRFSEFLEATNNDMVFTDLSKSMLIEARKKVGNDFYGVNCSVYNLPFKSSSFDFITSINVLNHIEDLEMAIGEMSRVLRFNGMLIINFSSLFSYYIIPGLFVNINGKSIGRNVYSHWISLKKFKRLLRKKGFEIVKEYGNVHIPKHMDFPIIRDLLNLLDTISRKSTFRKLAPTIFLKCIKSKQLH